MVKNKNENNAGLSVKQPPPKSSELNRKRIALVGSVIAILVILAFLFSINTGNQRTQSASSTLKGSDVNKAADTTGIDNLPQGYGDASKIDKLLGLNKKPQVVEKIPEELKNQLALMRQQQASLQSELERLKNAKAGIKPVYQKPKPKSLSPFDREAMSASIFFPGGAPRPLPAKPQEQGKKGKPGSTDKSGKQSAYDKANDQAGKSEFMEGKVNKDVTNQNTIQYPISKYTIFAGSTIPAILQSKLVSNVPGDIVARVTQNVYDTVTGQYLLIPKGSTLIGKYSSKITYGQSQLQAKFIRLIRPDGTSIILPNQFGVDGMGVSGFEDELDNHWMQLIGAAALSTVFNIPAVAANYSQQQSSYVTAGGTVVQPGMGQTFSNSALQSMGQTASQVGGKVTERAMNIQPTITINDGYQFSVLVTKDIVLPPFKTTF